MGKNDEYRIEKQETRLESQRISTAGHFNKFMDNMGEIKKCENENENKINRTSHRNELSTWKTTTANPWRISLNRNQS